MGKNFITLYKNKGCFYNAFDIDAYIMSLIFGYKVLSNRSCGFPESIFEKVTNILEYYKISYQVIYTELEPTFKDFKKLNKYEHFYNQTLKLLDRQNKIDLLINKITNADDKDIETIIKAIENVQNK